MGIYDSTKKLEEQAAYYRTITVEARELIKQIQQDKYREILTLRYLAGWSFRSISDELNYTAPKSVYHAHGWALQEAQKILNRTEAEKNGYRRENKLPEPDREEAVKRDTC